VSGRGSKVGVKLPTVFFAGTIAGRIGGLYEQVSASTFRVIHAAIVAEGASHC
jgi:hypothetical protein